MKLYPYQDEGVRFLQQHPRAYLADEMGLGKTVQACAAADLTANVDPDDGLAPCVICPASVVPVWQDHLRRFGVPGAVVSYGRMQTVPRHARFFIFDEAHYLKSRSARRTQDAVRMVRDHQAERVWMLSGTPMPNHPGELWTQLRILGVPLPRLVETEAQWWKHFCVTAPPARRGWAPRVLGAKNHDQLRLLLEPHLLRRRVAEVLHDLPPLRVDVQYLDAEPYTISVEGQEKFLAAFTEERAPTHDPEIARLRRMLGVWKAPLIATVLADELRDTHHKIVVFAHHREVLDILEVGLGVWGVRRLDGSTPAHKREQYVRDFQMNEDVRVFLGQNTAAGTGITLTAANQVVLAEPDWTPSNNAQMVKRVHRIGARDAVRARLFAVEGTLDEATIRVAERKLAMIESIID
jgi:SWI/SNF-related matrix-associated actin-dependent regulator 1 of chromatin subfamily A